MLNSNDSAKIVKQVANDLIRRDKFDIVNSMDIDSKVAFVNGLKTLQVVSDAIEKELSEESELFMLYTG